MTPIEFVIFDGDSDPNQPVYQIAEAMHKLIKIHSSGAEWEVIGYYYGDEGHMVLDIREKNTHPPQRTWVGLTELEKAEITSLKWWDWEDTFDIDGFVRAIEAKLKEKNNA